MANILIIAPHPDDETLACGGTILKYINEGNKVFWVICTEFYRGGKTPDSIELRNKEIKKVSEMFGFSKRFELGFDAASITYTHLPKMVNKITNIMLEVKPEVVFLPNRSDVHTDHQIIFKAAYSCTKNFNFPFIKQILMYETLSETEFAPALTENYFIPNIYFDVSEFFKKKLEIMKVYKSEVMQNSLPRSLSALSALGTLRGSAIGKKYAESFMLLKQIIL